MSEASRKEVHIKIQTTDDSLANKLIHAFNSNDAVNIMGSEVKIGCIDYNSNQNGAGVLAASGGELMKLNIESNGMTMYNSYEETKSEAPESEYDKGMRKAMQKIAVSCGARFAVDIGYETLPDLVESLINPKKEEKPKRVKVEYVRIRFDDVLYICSQGESIYTLDGEYIKIDSLSIMCKCKNRLYRRVETEITERDEFIEAALTALNANGAGMKESMASMLFDSGKFKLVEGE